VTSGGLSIEQCQATKKSYLLARFGKCRRKKLIVKTAILFNQIFVAWNWWPGINYVFIIVTTEFNYE